MEELKERILREGKVIGNDILKVDSFINYQVDPVLMAHIGDNFAEYVNYPLSQANGLPASSTS